MAARRPQTVRTLGELRYVRATDSRRLAMLETLRADYGDVVHARFLGRDYYLLCHPDDVHTVLVGGADHFYQSSRQRPADPEAERADHRRQRRLIQPAFQPARLALYGETMARFTADMLDGWTPGQPVEIVEALRRLTLRIAARTLFDADLDDHADRIGETMRLGQDYLSAGGGFLPTPRNLRLLRGWLALERETLRIIAERRRTGIQRPDVLSMIIAATDDDGTGFTPKEAHQHVTALLIAGHETSANALAWSLYLLAQHPDVQAALRAEVTQVAANRALTYADLDAMPYAEAVMNEALRLYPPAWVLARRALRAAPFDGYTLPANATVMLSPYLAGRDLRWFDDSLTFRPARWLDGLAKRLPAFAFFPFGGGAHVCTGQFFARMEIRLVLATVAARFRLSYRDSAPVGVRPQITLSPDRPIELIPET